MNNKEPRVTIADVARRTGYNKVTASVVLNGSRSGTRVSEASREKILAAAQEMGYQPNSSARAIITGRFGCVALLHGPGEGESYLPDSMVSGIHSSIIAYDLHLLQAQVPDDCYNRETFVPKFLREWIVDGLLVNYINYTPEGLLNIIERKRVPSIWINVKQPFDSVHPDDVAAGRTAAEHLLRLGHRRIAFVSHTPLHYSANDRYIGYEQAMRAAGLAVERIYKPFKVPEWVAFGREWLQSKGRPTAVICYDHYTSRPILFAALSIGVQAPADISIVSFADRLDAEGGTGRFMTVCLLPEFAMGADAVEMLVEKIAQPGVALESRALPVQMAVGDTCGPPRAENL